MEKNNIPLWKRREDYPKEVDFIAGSLLAISDREFQMRAWCLGQGDEVDWYEERMLFFDYQIDYIKDMIRKKEIKLSSAQIKSILRVHAMCITFNRSISTEDVPGDWEGGCIYLINHPYWIKITEKAKYALSLLKKP